MYNEEYYDEEYYDDEPYVEVNHEFTSIFHDESVLECVVYEGRLGPDHPGSHGMKTARDFSHNRDRQDFSAKELRSADSNSYYGRKDRSSEISTRKRKDKDTANNLIHDELLATRKRRYTHDGKTRYIPGSDKDKSAAQANNNAENRRHYTDDEIAGIGSSYRRSSAGKGHKSGISDRERKNLEEKRKRESKEIRRKEFHKLASKNEFAFLDIDII